MAAQLIEKDNVIETVLQNVNELENKIDRHEQYSRRANTRIHGVQEDVRGENGEAKVPNIINEKVGFLPARAVIVRFNSERLRDYVFRARARGSLRDRNEQRGSSSTAKRASLVFKTRGLKTAGRIADRWTAAGGRIVIKDNRNRIKELTDLNEYQDARVCSFTFILYFAWGVCIHTNIMSAHYNLYPMLALSLVLGK